MVEEKFIGDYINKHELNIQKMITDFKGYVIHIVNNNCTNNLSIEDKEEIVSDVFLSVWHNKDKIDNLKPLKNYIVGITKNLIKNKLRNNKKDTNNIYIEEDDALITLDTFEIIHNQEQINAVLTEELHSMKKIDYEIFAKFYYFDKSIKDISKELNISEGNVKIKLHRIRKKLKNSFQTKGLTPKVLATLLIFLSITGIVFAKDIIHFVQNIFKNTSEGVDTAIENGYIQEIDMNYVENDIVGIKINNILMDDYNLNINFEIDLQKLDFKEELRNIELNNLTILDESNNLIVFTFEDVNRYIDYCKNNGLEITYNNIAYSDGEGNFYLINQTDDIINFSYSNQSMKYPKSKSLNITFNQITLLGKNNSKSIFGDWNFKIDLDKKFQDRETLNYTLEYCNDNNLELIDAQVSETGTLIKFKTIWGDPVYNESDDDETKAKKKEEFFDRGFLFDNFIIKDAYVKNEYGQIFSTPQISDGDGACSQLLDGTVDYWSKFTLTTYDATDSISLIIETGSVFRDAIGEKLILNLKRQY